MRPSVKAVLEFFLLIFLVPCSAAAVRVSGKVRAANGEALPFVNVLVVGSTAATTTNIEGSFSLELPAGEYVLTFSMIGFHRLEKHVIPEKEDITVDVVMEPESYRLQEVEIASTGEDPAYAIIRNAQRKRRYNKEQVRSFTCEAYVKSTQRLNAYPKKFMGQKVELDAEIDSATGIFYLSESVSRISCLFPDNIKETMVSSKVSGQPKAYSFNRASDLLGFTLYEPHLTLAGLVPRGVVSPIADNSFFYYRFKLLGAFIEDGELVNRIAVVPRRENDPAFSGEIFVTEDSWRIHSADLFIDRQHQLQLLDTFRIRSTTMLASDTCRMPLSDHLSFSFDLMGFKGSGDILGVFSRYDLKSGLQKEDFTAEVLKVEKTSNEKDSLYWASFRPVPLTDEESKDYIRSDSARLVRDSPAYTDSIDRAGNRFKPVALLSGYTHSRTAENSSWQISAPLRGVQFNTVQGWNLLLSGSYTKRDSRSSQGYRKLEGRLQYGFSDRRWHPGISYVRRYSGRYRDQWSFTAGSEALQFNQRVPISPFINSLYSLFDANNYMKLFGQRSVRFNARNGIADGWDISYGVSLAERVPLENTTTFTFSGSDHVYTSNDPILADGDTAVLNRHTACLVEIGLVWIPGQRYVTYPEARYAIGSDWPAFEVRYRKGVPLKEGSPDFDRFEFHVKDEVDLRMIGTFSYRMGVGGFLSRKEVPFTDYRHFNGNRTLFSGFGMDDFLGFDYYARSTTELFAEVHAEQHMNGFLLNKLPLIRRLRLDEVISLHSIAVRGSSPVVELAAGVEKLNIFRVQVFSDIVNGRIGSPGIVLGIRRGF
ncbi:MAG: hypothetical protein RL213_1620 [Bacteroidota bacterium]|jgi:hypothetical protein